MLAPKEQMGGCCSCERQRRRAGAAAARGEVPTSVGKRLEQAVIALGWWGRQLLVYEHEDRQVLLEEQVVFKVEGQGGSLSEISQNESNCQHHTAQVCIHKPLLLLMSQPYST